jgi:hypothetical protein
MIYYWFVFTETCTASTDIFKIPAKHLHEMRVLFIEGVEENIWTEER